MTKRTAVPGRELLDPAQVIRTFRHSFRKRVLEDFRAPGVFIAGDEQPTYVAFEGPAVKVHPDDLKSLSIPLSHPVYCYVEYPSPGRISQATWRDWLGYIDVREIWDRCDTYAFDDSYSWCVVYTHETSGRDDYILQVGHLPGQPSGS